MARIRVRIVVAAIAALWLVGASPSRRAVYRMQGTIHVASTPFDRDMELHADAVVEPGRGQRDIVLHLTSMGYQCRLVAKRDAAGTLAFPPGQACVLEIRSPEAQGSVHVRLTSGRGRLREDDLSLALTSELSGTVVVGSGAPITVLGRPVPGTGGAEIPVGGNAQASAEGRRDRSRAAE